MSTQDMDIAGFCVTDELPAACVSLAEYLRPELFKALCDPRRLVLLGRLAIAPEALTVTDASSCCGVHISGVSRHLSILRQAGVVRAAKRGREVCYRLDHDALIRTLRGIADALEQCRAEASSTERDQEHDEHE